MVLAGAEAGAMSVARSRGTRSREGCGQCRSADEADRCQGPLVGTAATRAPAGEAILPKGDYF